MRIAHAPLLLAAGLVLALVAGLVLGPAAGLWEDGVAFDASIDVLLAGDQRAGAAHDGMEALLDGRTLVVIVYRDAALFSSLGMKRLIDLCARLEELPGVQDVKSMTHSRRPVLKPGFSLDPRDRLKLETLVPTKQLGQVDWDEVRAFVTDFPLARDLFVSRDGEQAMVLVAVERPLPDPAAVDALAEEVRTIVDEELAARQGGGAPPAHVLAFPFLEQEVRRAVRDDVLSAQLLAAGLVVTVLLLALRSAGLLLATAAFLAAGAATTWGLILGQGATLNMYTGLLLPLVSGLQLTFLLHLLTAYLDALPGSPSARHALGAGLRLVGRPSLLAAVTTALGLAGLMASEVGMLRLVGRLGAEAVLLVYALTFVPCLLVARFGDAGVTPPAPAGAARLAARLVGGVGRRRGLVVAAALAVVLACVPGLLRLRTDARATEFLGDTSPTKQGLAEVDAQLGGVNVFRLDVDCGGPDGAYRPEVLAFLEELRAHAEALPGVTNAYTYSLILALMNQVLAGGGEEALRPPDSAFLASVFTTVLRTQRWELLEGFLDEEARRTTLLLRTRDMPGSEYLAVVDSLLAFAEEQRPEGVTLDAKKGLHSLLEADRLLVRSQLKSLGTSAATILIALALLWRAWRPAVLVIAVNLPALLGRVVPDPSLLDLGAFCGPDFTNCLDPRQTKIDGQ